MTLQETIASRIVQLCKERNITPHTLFLMCGIDEPILCSILGEKGRNLEILMIKENSLEQEVK